MKRNMGNLDRGIRVLIAIVIAGLFKYDVIEGIFAYILMGLALIFLLTSLMNFCPLYVPLGTNTYKSKK